MSGDRYFITDQHAIYFLTFTVVDWIDVFTRPVYKAIITDSLTHCVTAKGLEIFAWVLMTNHLHLVARTNAPHRISDFMRDFKKFTSKKIVAAIQYEPESRREWMLPKMRYHALSTRRAENFKFWTDENHAVLLDKLDRLEQRINYTHYNPVRQGIVALPHEYLYSSALDYAGLKGLVPVTLAEIPALR